MMTAGTAAARTAGAGWTQRRPHRSAIQPASSPYGVIEGLSP